MALAHLALASTMLVAQATDSVWLPAEPLPYQTTVVAEEPGFDWGRLIPVVTSMLVPGTGQLLEGEWVRGLVHLGFASACVAAIQLGTTQADSTYKIVGGIGLLGIGFWSPWDAFANAPKPEPATP